MRKLYEGSEGSVKMVGMVIGVLVTLIISILILYSIAASVDTSGVDTKINDNVFPNSTRYEGTPSANASTDILDQSATFFTIAPILAIVIIAVVIIGYVTRM